LFEQMGRKGLMFSSFFSMIVDDYMLNSCYLILLWFWVSNYLRIHDVNVLICDSIVVIEFSL